MKSYNQRLCTRGRCTGLSGFSDNSELCNSIQAMGEGIFPKYWENYLQQRDSFDINTEHVGFAKEDSKQRKTD